MPDAYRAAAAGRDGRKLVAGLRPEALCGPGQDPPPGAVRVEVLAEFCENLGDEMIIHGQVGGDRFAFKGDPHSAPAMGTRIALHFPPEALHLFDGETGERLPS